MSHGNKKGRNRGRPQRHRPKINGSGQNKPSRFSRLKHYLWKHHLALSGILVPLIVGFLAYFTFFAEPNIKHIEHDEKGGRFIDRAFDAEGNMIMIMSYSDRFRNYSLKSGFIDKVELVPMNVLANIETKITDIEKRRIWLWQEQDVKVTFSIKISSKQVEAIAASDKVPILGLRAFDNTGKIIGEEKATRPYGMGIGFGVRDSNDPRPMPEVPIGTRLIP